MFTMMEQRIATIEQELSNALYTLGQVFTKELAAFEGQVDSFFGIDLGTANQPNSGSSQANASDSGSGSLSGVATTGHANTSLPQATPLDSGSSDQDGIGNMSADLGGTANDGFVVNIGDGTIGGDVNGTFSGQFNGTGTSYMDGKLADGNTFSAYGNFGNYTAGNGTFSGSFSFTGSTGNNAVSNDFDDYKCSGNFSGSVDQYGNISGTLTGTLNVYEPPANDDTLVWNPKVGNDASNEENWYDATEGVQGYEAPNANTPVVFDGTPNSTTSQNAPITWDDPKIPSMTLQNGYNQEQTINPGDSIELTGDAQGNSLYMDGTSSLNLNFGDNKSTFQIDNNATITNMNLTGVSAGQFIVASGTTIMAQSPSYTEKLGVQFTVNAGATVNDQSYTPIQLTAGNPVALIITIKGNMYFHWGPNNGIQLISGGGTYPADFIGVYGGLLGYYGTQGVKDTLTVPVYVNSGGTFRVSIDTSSPNPQNGFLIVQGAAPAGGGPASVYMNGANSEVQLAYGDTLECDNGYAQDDGGLVTTDATKCWLQVGANSNGTANINGGYLTINDSDVGYGKLVVAAATLNFDGKLTVGIDATNQNNTDLLSVLSNVATSINLEANSTLSVFVNNGNPAPGNQWVIIEGLINPINGNFSSLTTTPIGINLTGKVNPKDTTQYIVTS